LGGRKGNLFVKGHENYKLPPDMNMEDPDNQILATVKHCLAVSAIPVVLVSQDINVRVKADALGIFAEDYTTNQIVEKAEEVYTGFTQYLVDDAFIDRFYSGEKILVDEKDVKCLSLMQMKRKQH
jgi:PhoH-like ATPase